MSAGIGAVLAQLGVADVASLCQQLQGSAADPQAMRQVSAKA